MDTVRRATTADIDAAAAAQAEAFRGKTQDYLDAYGKGRWFQGQPIGLNDIWVLDEDGEIGSALVALPMTWWVGGVGYPVSAVSAVGVRGVSRRRGHASTMVRAVLKADVEEGRPVSILYPFQHWFYQRLGYATVGLTHYYKMPVQRIPDDPAGRRKVRALRDADKPAMARLYSDALRTGIGGMERGESQWAKRWEPQESGPPEEWAIFDDGVVRGFVSYRRTDGQLIVIEIVAADALVERALWAFIAAQGEQSTAIAYNAPTSNPIWSALSDPLMVDAQRRGFILRDAAHMTVSLMARLNDPAAAFARRLVPVHVAGAVSFDVQDKQLGDKAFGVTFDSGHCTVGAATEPVVRCDIVTLGQIFFGVIRASDAMRHGRLEGDLAGVRLLDSALPGPTPWLYPADYF